MIKNIGIEEQVRLWDGLKSYWSFDTTGATIIDIIGCRNLTASNVTWTTGKRGNCPIMNGTTSSLLTAGDSFTNAEVATGSLSMWIKVPQNNSNSMLFFSAKGWIALGANATTGYPLGQSDGGTFDTFGTANITDNNWHHLVYTWNASTGLLYVDGAAPVEKAQANAPTPESSASRTSGIGCNWNGSYYFVNGSIDEVAFWSNRILTVTDVNALYSAGNGKFYGTPAQRISPVQIEGLQVYYRLENGNDSFGGYNFTTITDVSYVSGKNNNCADFNNSSSFMSTGIFPFSSIGSVSVWLNPDITSASEQIMDGGAEATGITLQNQSCINIQINNNAIYVGIRKRNVGNFLTIPNFGTDVWKHVIYTWNGTTRALYVNGTLVSSTSLHQNNGSFNGQIILGKRLDNVNYYDGGIDELSIYNKELNGGEVLALYNNGNGLFY